MERRALLRSAVALAAGQLPMALLPAPVRAADKGARFDFAWLKGHAQHLSTSAYVPPSKALPDALANLDYDGFQAIRDRPEHSLWADQPLDFQVQFFHLGYTYREPVRMNEIVDGVARRLAYDPSMFDFGKSGVRARALPKTLDFAGLRIRFHTDWRSDLVAFLGASYFRAIGASRQFGLSARGLAIDCGADSGEEFPRFTEFWIERPPPRAGRLTVYALLDSPSVTGAYRFDIVPAATLIMEVDCALYPRKPIQRLGVAPLTSMYLCGENDRRLATDWRPEIHDSDGLAMCTGSGEWLWRPLVNNVGIRLNAFADERPRGFGLLQRDREFDHYQDDGVFYDRRPSLWVEPRGDWGKGSVQLLEMNAPDETFDNIVAFWNPAEPAQPGKELLFSYRMFWGEHMPFALPLAQVVATRTGIGGVIGQKRKYFSWRFAVDFKGGPLDMLGRQVTVQPVIRASRGTVEITSARPLGVGSGYRAMFDLKPADDSTEPVDLRMYLSLHGAPLTETWLYQWTPPPADERKF
jgi:periplasmic glucans biosynthesis protein